MGLNMKRILSIIFIVFLFYSSSNYGQDNGFGLGFLIGEPTGLSAKYWLDNDNALAFGMAYSFVRSNSAVSMHADYLYHAFDIIKSNYRIPLYYGFGARLRFVNDADNSLGARGVIGVAWLSDNAPFDVFVEVVPVFNLFPSTALNLDAAIGARYYFK
jgi:hypothetical protein